MGLGGDKMIIILIVVLILFGGQKIPEMMRGLGQGMKEFKKATRDDDDERALPGTQTVNHPTVSMPTTVVTPTGTAPSVVTPTPNTQAASVPAEKL